MSIKDYPQELRPYVFHGMDLNYRNGDKQATADCPWCGREGKFSIEVTTGRWKCWVCNRGNKKGGGNSRKFIQMLWERSDSQTSEYKSLAKDRKLLYSETLMHWGVAKSTIDRTWIVPGYSPSGKLIQLYRYVMLKSKRKALLGTPGLSHGVYGIPLFDKSKSTVFVCEGIWDAMALWELLGSVKEVKEKLKQTSNSKENLRADMNVIGIPGINAPVDRWLSLFDNKDVWLMLDNDHPKEEGQKSASVRATERAVEILSQATSSIGFLRWGKGGYNKGLPSGLDVRDFLSDTVGE